MKHEMTILAVAGTAMFCIGAGVTAYVMAPGRAAKPQPTFHEAKADGAILVIGYARLHPDPAINGPFADKLMRGEIKIVLEKPTGHALASFGLLSDGMYELAFDPARIKREPTRDELEDVLAILSHEHAHYRQFVEGEMVNYPRGGQSTETQCTLAILVEIDAHGKECRDAKAYGWESPVALDSCDHTMATLAEYFLRERADDYPACTPVWDFYAARVRSWPMPPAKKRATRTPRKRFAPTYLPPP